MSYESVIVFKWFQCSALLGTHTTHGSDSRLMGSMGLITRSRNFCFKFVLFVVIITTFVRSFSSANYSPNNVTNIIKSILDGYDIRLRPNFGGAALSIGMDLAIASFDSISEVNMDYTLTLYLHQYWRDERLDFSKQYNNDKDIELTLSGDFADQIWLPDTFFANDKNSFLHEVTEKNKMIRLKSDGSISYGMRFTSTLACMMDLHNYPMDSQNCTVEIESYGYTVSDLLMYWTDSPVTGVVDANLPQFTILGFEATDRNEKLATGTYQRLSLLFSFKRSIGYFIFQTYLPSILIVMLSWVSFWINHQATSARVTLGIMTVLTMTTISTGVRSSLPRISYVKAIDIYLVVSFVFVFAALLEYSLINYTYWGERAKKKVRTSRDNRNERRHHRYESNNSLRCTQPEPLIEYKDAATSPIHHLTSRQSTVWPNSSGISAGKRYYNPHENIHNPYLTGLTNDSTIRHRINNPQPINVSYPISQPNYNRQVNPMPFSSEAYDYKRKASKVKIHKIKDVNKIDRYSRILFPVSYMTFNALYWTFYRLY